LNQAYANVVKDSSTLNKYKGFSDEVYGEAGHDLITDLITKVPITKEQIFLDLGSGIGQVVMQVAAQAQCKASYGVEFSDTPATYAEAMSKEFDTLMDGYNKCHGDILNPNPEPDPKTLNLTLSLIALLEVNTSFSEARFWTPPC